MVVGRSRFDVAIEALGHVRRRQLLLDLLSTTEIALRSSGAPHVVSGRVDVDYPQLFHIHLPKLAAMGYVEWDRAAGTVRAGDRFAEIAPLLRLIDTHATGLPDGWR